MGNCHPIRSVYDVLISDVCANAVGLVVNLTLFLILDNQHFIALLQLIG